MSHVPSRPGPLPPIQLFFSSRSLQTITILYDLTINYGTQDEVQGDIQDDNQDDIQDDIQNDIHNRGLQGN